MKQNTGINSLLLLVKWLLFGQIFNCILIFPAWAQTKIVLDNKVLNGACNGYYDLNEFGFLLQYNKSENANAERDKRTGKLNSTFFYFSKDLTRRATIKEQLASNTKALANAQYMVLADEFNNICNIAVYDYSGNKITTHSLNLNVYGFSANQISRWYFTDSHKLILEIVDVKDLTHLFLLEVLNKNAQLIEADLPYPSANPFVKMPEVGSWKFLLETKGLYVMGRTGKNAAFGATSAASHLAFYGEDFSLYRELLIDNLLQTGQQMLSKTFNLVLNRQTQQVVLSAVIVKDKKPYALIVGYGIDGDKTLMKQLWRNELEIIMSNRHQVIEFDGVSVPQAPELYCNGKNTFAMVYKGSGTIAEEKINQFIAINEQGKVQFNKIQKGDLNELNLDAFCVDADQMYDRIYPLKMFSTLKGYCEEVNVEALDIYISDAGQELAVLKDNGKKQVIIYYFK